MTDVSIQIRDLEKTFSKLRVLDGISLSIPKGEFVSIVGPSGCGKSTLLKTIGGLAEPTAGTVLLDSLPPSRRRKEGYLGFVFQNPVLLPWRTLEENVRLPLEVLGRNGHADRVAEMIDTLGLNGFDGVYPRALSGGMQQRAALARALLYQPSLLLMDEPFGAVDELTRGRLNFELLGIWETLHPTVVFVTHAVDEAVLLSDRIIVLSPRPAKIIADTAVELPRPRSNATLDSEAFIQIVQCVRKSLNTISST